MTTITVEPTESGILVSEAETLDDAAWLDPLPPLTAARYLCVASDAIERLRQHDAPLIDSIRPYAQSTLVALEAGFGSAGEGEDASPAQRLAAELGVTVVAPEGRFISCDGTLFAVGAESCWVAYNPTGAKILHGRRYPQPAWQMHLPPKITGTAQIPAGLWITDHADATHAVHLADIAVHPQQLLIVVGSPGAPTPGFERVRDVLRELPEQMRASAVLIGYDETSLDHETIRLLAAELQQPLRIAHGVTIGGRFVRLDLAHEIPTGTFARESVCTSDGVFTLERWSAPLGLTNISGNAYRLTDDWVVDVIPAGLVLRPAHQPPGGAGDALPVVSETLTVMLCGDGTDHLKRVVGPLRQMLAKLRDYAPTQLIPGDRAARRLIRNAFPGTWAPTARLALTDDGRIIAASVDEDEIETIEEQHSEAFDGADDFAPRIVGDHDAQAQSVVDASAFEASNATEPTAPVTHLSASVHDAIVGGATAPITSSTIANAAIESHANELPSVIGDAPAREVDDALPPVVDRITPREAPRSHSPKGEVVTGARPPTSQGPAAAIAQPGADALTAVTSNDPSDALARALRGSAATAGLLAKSTRSSAFDAKDAITGSAGRGNIEPSLPENEAASASPVATASRRPTRAESAPPTVDAVASPDDAAVGSATVHTVDDEAPIEEPAEEIVQEAAVIEVPRDARSTAEQRHRVRSTLGARYDVASRSVSQLLAQQPGMRVGSGDRSTLLTTLSVVSVFADDPTAQYDLDFHTCLAEGLTALPTTRSIVVRGLPEASTASTDAVLLSPFPFISASVDAPLTGPMEALIWTTTGRRLDRLMVGTDAATDIILPAHTQLRVLGTTDGPVPRLLLAEAGVNDDNVLSRLHDAATSRNDARALSDSRWLGEPLMAV